MYSLLKLQDYAHTSLSRFVWEKIFFQVLTKDFTIFGILSDQVEHVLGLHDLLERKSEVPALMEVKKSNILHQCKSNKKKKNKQVKILNTRYASYTVWNIATELFWLDESATKWQCQK